MRATAANGFPMKSKPNLAYAEFAVASNFSFLRGASHPEQLISRASDLGLAAIGLCDRNTVAGVVRAHVTKREHPELTLAYHPGARLVFADGTPDILAYPRDRDAWGRLCRLLTRGNLRAEKGECILTREDLLDFIDGLELIVMPATTRDAPAKFLHHLRQSYAGEKPCLDNRTLDADESRARQPSRHCERSEAIQSLVTKSGLPRRPAPRNDEKALARLAQLREAAPGRVRLAAMMHYRGNDRARLAARAALARRADVPLIAVNDVLYHHFERRELQDVLTSIRAHVTIDNAGRRLAANAERYLKPASEMERLFADAPEAVEETLRLSAALAFSLDQLKYEYPDESVAGFATPQDALEHLAWEGAKQRYPNGIPAIVATNLKKEFPLIARKNYAPYFLTVYDVVRYARSQGILCQGRGSAANSTVCFCLGVTPVDPVKCDLLFDRFMSDDRDEPPDIDVDFEHERREEVIQYLYGKYGRTRAGIAATVISYRGRSAIREVGKAFGLSEDMIGALSSSIWGMGGGNVRLDALSAAGLDPEDARVKKIIALAKDIQGFPRHLSQHVGGFVITRSRLDEVAPVMNGGMDARTHVEWDKDDLDALDILKVDVLGLGMLTCIRKAFELTKKHYGESFEAPPPEHGANRNEAVTGYDLARVPNEEREVYDMLCRADSIGVFQVESRAQMSMLPRLRPREFYDLVIEVAIVRPGPIQGDMVHPYLRRRDKFRTTGEEPDYPAPAPGKGDPKELRNILHKTLGVPLFQEQAMRIAIEAGGFAPSEADKLRRAMATFKRTGTIGKFRDKMIGGMTAKGYPREFAARCFSQIEGFGEYGFPESHAASFALLVYASAWLKCRYPDVFAAALLNAQPMGFYASAQIVRDVREHGVEVRPVDVNFSGYDSTLEKGPVAAERLHPLHASMHTDIRSTHAIRLGLREINGQHEDPAKEIVSRRGDRPYASVRDVWVRTGLDIRVMERLADADAFGSIGLTRRQGLWAVKALGRAGDQDALPLFALPSPRETVGTRLGPPPRGEGRRARARRGGETGADISDVAATPPTPTPDPSPQGGGEKERARAESGEFREPAVALPAMPLGEEVVNDYRFLDLSLRAHPASFLRADLAARGIVDNATLRARRSGERVTVSGLVTIRQRPGSANGVVFMTIEDETATANIIVWPDTFERFRPLVLGARYLGVLGRVQHENNVIHVVAERLDDLTALLAHLTEDQPPIEQLARADEVKRPEPGSWRQSRRKPVPLADPLFADDDVAADLAVHARGTAHAPSRHGGSKAKLR
jgi:error-prone DNA polymerase